MEENQVHIPDGWSVDSLGNILNYEQPYKYTVDTAEYNDKSGIPVLTAGKSFLLGYTNEVHNVYKNTPVIIFDDFTTESKFVDFPFKVKSSAMKFLKPKNPDALDIKVIFGHIQNLKIRETGGDHKRRWISEFSKLKVALPPYTEQTQIATILSKVDETITHTEQLIAKYTRIKTGLMQDLLTKGIDENGNIRSEETHEFKDSPLGKIPKEWDVKKMGDLILAIDPQPDHRTPAAVTDGVSYVGISDVLENGEIDIKSCRKVGFNVLEKQQRLFTVDSGDIIFGKIGTIGKPKVLPLFSKHPFTLSANIILIKPHECPDFVYWSLISSYVEDQVNLAIHSTSQPAFGMQKIRDLDILTPLPEERDRITSKLDKLNKVVQSEKLKLSKYQSLKTGLMQDLLSGKVRTMVNGKCLIVNDKQSNINH